MDLTKEEEQLLINEIRQKMTFGMSFKKYRELVKGCEIWRRGYLMTYNNSKPSYERSREQKYFLGLIFRSIEQFKADVKSALFANDPFFTVKPRGGDNRSDAIAEAVQAVMEYNTTIPTDYAVNMLQGYTHAAVYGVAMIATYYDYRESSKIIYQQEMNPENRTKNTKIWKYNEAVVDHPDFDLIYPTRVIVDPNAKAGRLNLTAEWRIIERQRPAEWYRDKQILFDFSDKVLREIKDMSGMHYTRTEGVNNLNDMYNLQSSKIYNDIEYVGRINDERLHKKFDKDCQYIVTMLNDQIIIRADINVAPDGLGLHCMNLIPDIDGSIYGMGIAHPSVDYQRAVNEWYNLRMRGLQMAVNPAYLVNSVALPNWKSLIDHPAGKIFPTEGSYNARDVLQPLNVADTSGSTWEQMMSFTQRDHDLTAGTSASRLGSVESVDRTATELSQVKEGADRRSNLMIFNSIRTGHKPTLWSMLKYTLQFWSTPRVLNLINRSNFQRVAVQIQPSDIRNADVQMDIIDATGASVDQQMRFYANLYQMSLQDPMINRTATLLNFLKFSNIVRDPYDLIQVDPRSIVQNKQMSQLLQMEASDTAAKNLESDTMGGRLGANLQGNLNSVGPPGGNF